MAVTKKQLENLVPAKKGEVRNPNGKPKGIPNAKTRYKRLLELVSKKDNPVTGEEEEFTQIELMDMAVFNKALKGDLAAYREIMDRLEGKSTQNIASPDGSMTPTVIIEGVYGNKPKFRPDNAPAEADEVADEGSGESS